MLVGETPTACQFSKQDYKDDKVIYSSSICYESSRGRSRNIILVGEEPVVKQLTV